MHSDRNAILSLVASGRITAREAERVLAVSRDGEDSVLTLALCLAFAAMLLPQLANLATVMGQTLAALSPAVERLLLLLGRMV